MLDSVANEMLKPLLKGAKQRLVTVAFLFSILFAGVEASTQLTSLFLLNRRIETTSRLLEVKGITPQQSTELLAVQASNIGKLSAINETLRDPASFLLKILFRFLKGLWPVAPFLLLVIWLSHKIIPKVPEKGGGRMVAAAFSIAAFSIVTVFGVANGLMSAYWNTSPGFWKSVVVFPLLSAVFIISVMLILMVLEEPEAKKDDGETLKKLTKLADEVK